MNGSSSTSTSTSTPEVVKIVTPTTPTATATTAVVVCDNYINGEYIPSSTNEYLDVLNPSNSKIIGKVTISNSNDVNHAVQIAKDAFDNNNNESSGGGGGWSKRYTIKQRAACMMKFHSLIEKNSLKLAELIVLENGKNITEALADVAKGNETIEWACSLPSLACGNNLKVSSQVSCEDRRDPLGVVVSIVPFNFPFMVPMWTVPIALVMGNTVILKPSEKVPLTMNYTCQLIKEAGFPDGVFNIIHGTKECVECLIDHPDTKAITFVGSSPIAKIVSNRCRSLEVQSKRCTALGGAKNHLIALSDCDFDTASSDITVSFAGCAGQRCMAASVLLLVEDDNDKDDDDNDKDKDTSRLQILVNKIVDKSSKIEAGNQPGQMGPVIDEVSYKKIISYIEHSEQNCDATILLDGRSWSNKSQHGQEDGGDDGSNLWIGPTIILHSNKDDKTMSEEVFGPVLSIFSVPTWEDAIEIENKNPFGNAASIYTSVGGNAEWFTSRFRSSMLGINIGIPVPREPFSFGGLYGTRSKYGDMDITGDGAMEFFSNRVKVTSKWPIVRNGKSDPSSSSRKRSRDGDKETSSKAQPAEEPKDAANFAGQM